MCGSRTLTDLLRSDILKHGRFPVTRYYLFAYTCSSILIKTESGSSLKENYFVNISPILERLKTGEMMENYSINSFLSNDIFLLQRLSYKLQIN